MKSKIKQIIEKIDVLNEDLRKEYSNLAQKYGFSIRKKAVIFLKEVKAKNKKLKEPAWHYMIPENFRHFLSIPFIYMMIVPAVILDFFVTLFNWVALPLYRIPIVKRSDYFIYDRRFLDYLNVIQKANCLYCSYVNGLFAYAGEIGARTERYWCPIKAAHKQRRNNDWYKEYADYGNPSEWNEKFNDNKAFENINKSCKL